MVFLRFEGKGRSESALLIPVWTCTVKKLLKINHENTKQDIEIKLAAFGRTSLTG